MLRRLREGTEFAKEQELPDIAAEGKGVRRLMTDTDPKKAAVMHDSKQAGKDEHEDGLEIGLDASRQSLILGI